ncbi:dihydroneopterin aldolase [Caldimonas sp. KR1-144]|uniref:dihydroneopterin aldolase n=1 Tax=Caldimonas sp. KR1-144 TaxID=3400911 RepID=UPI003BFD5FB9
MSSLLDPRLSGCRRLFLCGFEIEAEIGIHAHELQGPQRMCFDVDLYVPLALTTPAQDHIDEVIDYDVIRATIAERVSRGRVALQETLADDIAASLLARPGVRAVRVATAKPDVYPDCDAVGVEVFRFKSDEEAR